MLDLRFRVRGALRPGPEIAVILVDEAGLSRLGRWHLSRRLYADAVNILDRAGARVIVAEARAAILVRYRARDWVGARQALAWCRGRDPRFTAFYSLYEKRLAYLVINSPAADWNGIFMA